MTLTAWEMQGKNLVRTEVARLKPGSGGGLETVEEKRRLEKTIAADVDIGRTAKTDRTIVAAMAVESEWPTAKPEKKTRVFDREF